METSSNDLIKPSILSKIIIWDIIIYITDNNFFIIYYERRSAEKILNTCPDIEQCRTPDITLYFPWLFFIIFLFNKQSCTRRNTGRLQLYVFTFAVGDSWPRQSNDYGSSFKKSANYILCRHIFSIFFQHLVFVQILEQYFRTLLKIYDEVFLSKQLTSNSR